ncbi:TIGR02680 family protein [Crassaminicella indica]|uniref:TIGR02680 family protein n=1 Tax=Crassaminicella indica TaxID=2855394 RepID=A0ABX8RBY8_9CLOT|nr:TIGR02680 family protein [Crassaminicella indica]QXM06569.1 TIGR02680 family protein [Crassaminicella indica]
MENRWVANKLGLVNFWYYDFEEFELADGKLLLRGSNGSGKSVTMQSFIPLLLDGNKAPERLDPFGTKSRKMENYLLDEETDEKTAYLYIEFKRKSTENYLTIGMGMKAVRNRPLDSWYFIVTDGRRINQDIYLYKDAGTFIPLTKKQLENAIGKGGFFTTGQRKYMEKVNEYLFGFDDCERYEELINLLIQLRSPKLSKDFKPTEIYKILEGSLRVLSEDDLRPMSESMESMDNLQNSLEELQRALKATKNIKNYYDRYNKFCLYEKGMRFYEKNNDIIKLKGEVKALKNNYKSKEEELSNMKNEIKKYESVLKDAEIKYEHLRNDDALRVKEALIRLEKEVLELKDIIKNKENELEKKKNLEREREEKLKSIQNEYEHIHYQIKKEMKELYILSEEFGFEEGKILKDEMVKDLEGYNLQFVKISINKYMNKIKEAIKALTLFESIQKDYSNVLQEKEKLQRDFKAAKEELIKREEILLNTKEELKVHYIKWNENNQIIKLYDDEKQSLFSAIDNISDTFLLGDLNKVIRDAYNTKKNTFTLNIERKKRQIQEVKINIEAFNKEIEVLRAAKEIEPNRSEGVIRNRQKLSDRGIPYVPLYKAIDFKDDVSEDIKKAIESAFVDMGMLDALIVDEKYKEEVLQFQEGEWDRYIFAKENIMKHNLTTYFQVDKEGLEGVSYQTVDRVLQGIFLVDDELVFIDENGNYKIGALRGKASENYILKYIGGNSRKRHRERLIEENLKAIELLTDEVNERELEIIQIENCLKKLENDMKLEPKSEDLREALKLIDEGERDLKSIHNSLIQEEERFFEVSEKLKQHKKMVWEKTEGINLNKNLEAFQEAKECADDYYNGLSELRVKQNNLRSLTSHIKTIEDGLEDVRDAIDQLYYEISYSKKKHDEKNEEICSFNEVLKTSGINKIEEELEKCIKIKNEYPEMIKSCTNKKGKLEEYLDHLKTNIESKINKLEEEEKILCILEEIFLEEYALGYVLDKEEGELIEITKKIISLAKLEEEKGREFYSSALIESISKNGAELRDFALKQITIFDKYNIDESIKSIYKGCERVDIRCRVQGREISFYELSSKIEKDIEEIKLLISNEERRIFEEILLNTISTKIRSKIYLSKTWVDKINALMESMNTSSSLALSLRWIPKKAESEGQLDIAQLLKILERGNIASEEDMKKLANHFGDKVKEAIRSCEETGEARNYHTIIKEVLDYRKWYEFKLYFTKKGERKRELTNNAFFQFSGGEKAMSMYIPLFSAVYARYDNARGDCPHIIAMDEAFAGVDENNIRDMFRLLKDLDLDYIINSQILWGDYDTVDNLSICELVREENDDVVAVIRYHWNGIEKKCLV